MSTILKAGIRRAKRKAAEVIYVHALRSADGQFQVQREFATLQLALDLPGGRHWMSICRVSPGPLLEPLYLWWPKTNTWKDWAIPPAGVAPVFFVASNFPAGDNMSNPSPQYAFWHPVAGQYMALFFQVSVGNPSGLRHSSTLQWIYNFHPGPDFVTDEQYTSLMMEIVPQMVPVVGFLVGAVSYFRYTSSFVQPVAIQVQPNGRAVSGGTTEQGHVVYLP